MSWLQKAVAVENRFLDWARSAKADTVAERPPTGRLDDFRGHKYCVLVTYKKNGDAVPSPLWFGIADGKLYAHTMGVKVKRIERNPVVRVAPSNFRGAPTAAPLGGTARALTDPADIDRAERAIAANYGVTRRIYYKAMDHSLGTYIEVSPGSTS